MQLYSYGLSSYGLCSYGLCSYGLCSYGLCSYGLSSYGLCGYGMWIQCSGVAAWARTLNDGLCEDNYIDMCIGMHIGMLVGRQVHSPTSRNPDDACV